LIKLRNGEGLLVIPRSSDEDFKSRIVVFEEPTLENGLHKDLSLHPGILLCSTERKSSRIQNQTQVLKSIIELRIFLSAIGITDFSKCKFLRH